jgi:hypothetical protein
MNGQFIDHYNTVRLHSGIGYVTPQDTRELGSPGCQDRTRRSRSETNQRVARVPRATASDHKWVPRRPKGIDGFCDGGRIRA